MCCRYYVEMSPELRPIIEEANRSPLRDRMTAALSAPFVSSGEVFPGQIAPVIATSRRGARAAFPMFWGFRTPGLRSLVLNARVETAASRSLFRDSWASHRCVIPASWYLEWEHIPLPNGKKKTGPRYAISPREAPRIFMAGLYRLENGYPSFVVLTREPAENIRFIHDRMPLLLPESLVDPWICPDAVPEDLASHALTDVIWRPGA